MQVFHSAGGPLPAWQVLLILWGNLKQVVLVSDYFL